MSLRRFHCLASTERFVRSHRRSASFNSLQNESSFSSLLSASVCSSVRRSSLPAASLPRVTTKPSGFEGFSRVILEPANRAACPGIVELATEDLRQRGLQDCAGPKPQAKNQRDSLSSFCGDGRSRDIPAMQAHGPRSSESLFPLLLERAAQ